MTIEYNNCRLYVTSVFEVLEYETSLCVCYICKILAKCPLAKCPLAKCPLAKCPLAKCPGFVVRRCTLSIFLLLSLHHIPLMNSGHLAIGFDKSFEKCIVFVQFWVEKLVRSCERENLAKAERGPGPAVPDLGTLHSTHINSQWSIQRMSEPVVTWQHCSTIRSTKTLLKK